IQINGNCTIRAYYYPNARDQVLGLTNYIGVAGARGTGHTARRPGGNIDPLWAKYAGVFDNRTKVTLAGISDGSSNTLLFGEGIGAVSDSGRQYAWTWMSFGAGGTWQGLAGPSTSSWGQFSSRHTGVVLFCLADGAVRGIRRDGTAWS